MTDSATSELGSLPDPVSAASRLLTEQDAERRAFEAWCEVADYTPNDPEAPHTEAFYGGYRAALVARDAELAKVRRYAHGFKDAVAELEADLDRVKAIALHRLQLLDKRDAELAAAQRREVAARDHMVHMLKEAGVSADWRYWQARTETAEAEVTRLRAALAEAGVVLEVLAGQIADKPYRELSRDFQQTIMAATLTTREALSREASDTRTLASSGGEQA